MMPPIFQSVAAPSGAVFDHVRRSYSETWTGDKRRRTTGGPSHPLGAGSSSDDTKDDAMLMVHQEGDSVFSAEDDIDERLLSHCYEELKLRERPVYVQMAPKVDTKGKEEVYQRLCSLRFRHYNMLQEGSLNWDDTAPLVPASDYPDEVFNWDDPFEPSRSIYGWTYDPRFSYLKGLDDYQRIVPTRADLREYADWDKYRLAFSTYEVDEDYIKYWAELSKKMKWVEDILLLDRKDFLRLNSRGRRQALRIAADFCHLPASLAALGYEEYVSSLQYYLDRRKGYDQLYFEVWNRLSKHGMSFKEALKDIVETGIELPSKCLSKIQAELKGSGLLQRNFNICMAHIRERVDDVGEGTFLKEHFTEAVEAVYSEITIPKIYVDYAKKKLEVARRIHLNPGMGQSLD